MNTTASGEGQREAGRTRESDRLSYFRAVYEGFTRAEEASGSPISRFYDVGGYTIRLRFAGPGLFTQLTPAIAHLETEPVESPSLTVCLWDSMTTATPLPLLVASLIQLLRLRWWEQLDGRRQIKGYSSNRVRTTFHLGPDILSVLDTEENLAVYWVEDARAVPHYERGYPLQTILNWWAERRGRTLVHAGAVGRQTGGVLLAGQGGSGKSTTALVCALAGLAMVSDDYTLTSLDPVPYAYSLYNTAKLRTRDDLERFPQVVSWVSNSERLDEEKALIFLHERAPETVLRGFPIRAVLVPQQMGGGTETRVQATAPVAALRALAPSTMLQLPGAGQQAFHAMSRLVMQVPCYTLELGDDPMQSPQVIAHLLEELS